MKIAFVGKGGSGKTTISALFARHLAAKGFSVLAIDADINQHLAETIGAKPNRMNSSMPLSVNIDFIKEYLRGDNPLIKNADLMIKTAPPGPSSKLIEIAKNNPIFDRYSHLVDGIRLMETGVFNEDDIGIHCYHSKTGTVELLLNHLIDREHEYVIVDMTAGADAFASGLFTRFDTTFCVVEPTIKSLGVYKQYFNTANDYGVDVKVIGNKIDSPEDSAFLEKEIGKDLTAVFSTSPFVKNLEKGLRSPISDIEPANAVALSKMKHTVDMTKKDWRKFYRQAAEFHIKNARSWGNASVGTDITNQANLDHPFIPDVIDAETASL